MEMKKLKILRKEIDRIDSKIIGLINKRGRISYGIGQLKKLTNEPPYSPDRESQVYTRITKANSGPIANESLKAVYREIMSACLALEKPVTIAYLGPELTFTHQASLKKFGSSSSFLSCDSISGVFRAVEKANADYGVVPIENSTEGAVSYTLDEFIDSPLCICSEVYYPVHHSFLSKTRLNEVKKVYSNPQVFGQCRMWLEETLPGAKLYDVASTIKAAEIASKEKETGCIASALAAGKYNLKVITRNIEDLSPNITRFLVIGKKSAKASGSDKTSIVFSIKDRPGALHDILSVFKKSNINLTKIESRPSKKDLWKYYFFVDMEGHSESPRVKKALEKLERKCYFLKVLGSYPRE